MKEKLYLEAGIVERIQENANGRARTIEEYLEEVMKEDKLTEAEIREIVKEEVEAAITKAGNHFRLLYIQSKK